jgi:hypothetical protein
MGSTKAIHVPQEGDFLTDGTRLVEVVGKEREGIQVLDATVSADIDPEDIGCDVIPVKEAVEQWRVVTPTEEQRVA